MEKDKLIEILTKEINEHSVDGGILLTPEEAKAILTSLTAPVPDGKECEVCETHLNRIDELVEALTLKENENTYLRDQLRNSSLF